MAKREIEFTIDAGTGEMTADFHGVIGPDCDVAEKILDEQFGAASQRRIKMEDYRRQPVRQTGHTG